VSYRVEFTTSAARQVKKLPRPARDRVLDAVEDLAEDPRPHGAKMLVGEETAWRIRVGDYRVIYDVFDDALTVTVIRAAHRREVYSRRR
jgi:mRNA interferase RelE/StbE